MTLLLLSQRLFVVQIAGGRRYSCNRDSTSTSLIMDGYENIARLETQAAHEDICIVKEKIVRAVRISVLRQ